MTQKPSLQRFRVFSADTGDELTSYRVEENDEEIPVRLQAFTLKSAKHQAKRIFNGPVRVEPAS